MIRGRHIPPRAWAPDDRPRCDHEIHPSIDVQEYEYRVRRHAKHPERYPAPPERCIRKARYRIEGYNFCTQHAGKVVLDALFPEGQTNERPWMRKEDGIPNRQT